MCVHRFGKKISRQTHLILSSYSLAITFMKIYECYLPRIVLMSDEHDLLWFFAERCMKLWWDKRYIRRGSQGFKYFGHGGPWREVKSNFLLQFLFSSTSTALLPQPWISRNWTPLSRPIWRGSLNANRYVFFRYFIAKDYYLQWNESRRSLWFISLSRCKTSCVCTLAS